MYQRKASLLQQPMSKMVKAGTTEAIGANVPGGKVKASLHLVAGQIPLRLPRQRHFV
jgi:hypothetical protein